MIQATFNSRKGIVAKPLLLALISLGLLACLGFLILQIRPDAKRFSSSQQTVRVYCASGIAKPVEQIIRKFNRDYGAHVEIVRTGGSGELAGQIKTEFKTNLRDGADLYITADDRLLTQGQAEGVYAERFSLAEQKPVIAVASSRKIEIRSVIELVQSDDLKFGVASERAAVGKIIRNIAKREGVLTDLESKKTTDAENVMTLAQALVAGSLDAAVIWDTTVAQINQANSSEDGPLLEISAFADPLDEFKSDIAIGVIARSKAPTDCLRFARYLTAPETGKMDFTKLGFSFIEGDTWKEIPEIHLYCGSMFTPVLETAVRSFATREGVNIYPRWEGCGKLVASMESIEDDELFPDAYLACDESFLEQVRDRFEKPTTVSHNQIVMAARVDLDTRIEHPRDLLNRDLRIGLCDPDQSALGRLTQTLLSNEPYQGLYDQLDDVAAVTVDVGPTLMSQLIAGGLDVAFVYRSNVMASAEFHQIQIIEIANHGGRAIATQPWAISKTTQHSDLMERLFDWINRAEMQKRFRDNGFEWIGK